MLIEPIPGGVAPVRPLHPGAASSFEGTEQNKAVRQRTAPVMTYRGWLHWIVQKGNDYAPPLMRRSAHWFGETRR